MDERLYNLIDEDGEMTDSEKREAYFSECEYASEGYDYVDGIF